MHLIALHYHTVFRCVDNSTFHKSEYLLTIAQESQAWQKKACQAPVRNNGPLTRRIGEALIIIATLVLIVRFTARWRIQNSSIGWDDWTILLAWIGLLPSTALVQIMTYHGMGKDIWNVEPSGITLMLKVIPLTFIELTSVDETKLTRTNTAVLHRTIHLPTRHRHHKNLHCPPLPSHLPERSLQTLPIHQLDRHSRPARLPSRLHHLLRRRMQAHQLLLAPMGRRARRHLSRNSNGNLRQQRFQHLLRPRGLLPPNP